MLQIIANQYMCRTTSISRRLLKSQYNSGLNPKTCSTSRLQTMISLGTVFVVPTFDRFHYSETQLCCQVPYNSKGHIQQTALVSCWGRVLHTVCIHMSIQAKNGDPRYGSMTHTRKATKQLRINGGTSPQRSLTLILWPITMLHAS